MAVALMKLEDLPANVPDDDNSSLSVQQEQEDLGLSRSETVYERFLSSGSSRHRNSDDTASCWRRNNLLVTL